MKILNGASQSGQTSGAARMFMMVASMLMVALQSASATQADDTSIVLSAELRLILLFVISSLALIRSPT